MDIKASAAYNKETMKKFLRFNMFKGRFYKITPYIYGVLVVIFIFISIMYQISLRFDLFMTAAAVILLAAYLVQIITFYFYPNVKMKNRDEKADSENFYIFHENFFEYYTSKTGPKKRGRFNYENIFKVFETKEFFYLYINKKGAFIVDKEKIHDGEISEVSNILREKVGKGKFIKCI